MDDWENCTEGLEAMGVVFPWIGAATAVSTSIVIEFVCVEDTSFAPEVDVFEAGSPAETVPEDRSVDWKLGVTGEGTTSSAIDSSE